MCNFFSASIFNLIVYFNFGIIIYGEKRRMKVVEIKEAKAVKKFINMADDI